MLEIVKYEDKYEKQWDNFVINETVNGTFLQTRLFLNYHPKNRFRDCSVLIIKKNSIVAVIPGCEVYSNGKKVFSSHAGSTFGGIIIRKKDYNARSVLDIIDAFLGHLRMQEFGKVILKLTSDIFCLESSDLLQYALFNKDFKSYKEISTYIDLSSYNEDIKKNFTSGQKENLRHSMKHELEFKQIFTDEEINKFYIVLCDNLAKFNTSPIHTANELIDFKQNRLKNIILFFGVYFGNEMIAGSMLFKFRNVIHTQYLATKQDMIEFNPMTFLYYNLINEVRNMNYDKLSWGISTEENGKLLNTSLLAFKESFGSKYTLNRTFYKET